MRPLLLAGVVALCIASASASASPRTISHLGTTLRIPSGWHASLADASGCDPRRLAVVSATPLRIGARGALAPPPARGVLILLLEDVLAADRPAGDLRRPAHFAWGRLTRLDRVCGLPLAPAFLRYFKERGRYLGFIVFPGARIDARTRSATLAVMDSLRVATRR
jgi:hypothetical protein